MQIFVIKKRRMQDGGSRRRPKVQKVYARALKNRFNITVLINIITSFKIILF